jgi:uncharacterized protein DUF6445
MTLHVIDGFVPNPEAVKRSAIRAGFGTWNPGKGDMGASFYSGVGFWGDHATLLRALHGCLRQQFIPNSMFFRMTNPSMESALIHSDREYGDFTAIVYLSEGTGSGTGFYRHRESGLVDMPPISELLANPKLLSKLQTDSLKASEEDWEMYHFVEARLNRCVIFDAPKIHCRLPKNGYGSSEEDSRLVWVCHFGLVHETTTH